MLFNSLHFLIFFPIVVLLYFAIPYRHRWGLLLIASYYFYMCWKLEYIVLILISTVIAYISAIAMERQNDKSKRKKLLILSLCANFGILFLFKYFNFFNDSFKAVFNYFNIFYNVPAFDVLLPVGISFYTFQTLSYSIDVYWGKKKAEKHLGIFALYVAFFPQLVAGPIERSTRLLPQFYKKYDWNYDRVTSGLRLILWGFFKKVVIADRLAAYVNAVYNNVEHHNGLSLLIATYFFAFQIYCDFSGYSDIAIGSARILGFDLMENFKLPYLSKSVSEFWKRWHISLSSWFRDYLYIPIGGNRVKKWRWYYNVMIVFLISGLWHGANWTFAIWGALHGAYLLISAITLNIRKECTDYLKLHKYPYFLNFINIFVTFHLVCFAWIFFRANHVNEAFLIVTKIFSLQWGQPFLGDYKTIFYGIPSLFALLLFELLSRNTTITEYIEGKNIIFRWSFYSLFISLILLAGVFDVSQFIYFQF